MPTMQVLTYPAPAVEGLVDNWKFEPSRVRLLPLLKNPWFLLAESPPPFAIIRPPVPRDVWISYFVYAPTGVLDDSQLFTLGRLRDLGLPLFVVCASPSPREMPVGIGAYCDALCWKGMSGYDFSAYSLALRVIADNSPGSDVFVLNDSMFGPFSDFRPFMRSTPWGFSGLTASGRSGNHIQSYAFMIKNVCADNMHGLRGIFSSTRSYSRAGAVITHQEVNMARIASRSMSVGACWFGDGVAVDDPCLRKPFALMSGGFPFMKKSLLGKMRGFQSTEECTEKLRELGHPV
jgi:hypothetical protein